MIESMIDFIRYVAILASMGILVGALIDLWGAFKK